jgi:hypothetical protein
MYFGAHSSGESAPAQSCFEIKAKEKFLFFEVTSQLMPLRQPPELSF